jgi:hypothetical protein
MVKRTLGVTVLALWSCAAEDQGFTDFTVADGGRRDAATLTDRGAATDAPRSDLGASASDVSATEDLGAPPADVVSVYDTPIAQDGCAMGAPCTGRADGCQARETCGNGVDDDCNGAVDDVCPCLPGTVQDCSLGPPGRRAAGVCSGGTQRCAGSGEFGTWAACEGAIGPSPEVCDGADNDCNGCVDDGLCCNTAELTCPGADDPRVPTGRPFSRYLLRGAQFFSGAARSFRWTVTGGPCERLLPRPSFNVEATDRPDLAFTPTLSGDYTVTVTVVTREGRTLSCTFVVHIEGPGMRVELCWDTSTTVDLDLYVHDPSNTAPWFSSPQGPLFSVTNASCNWSNCEANIRGSMGRANWGYANSPLSACEGGPLGPGWRALGFCANPRLDIDNNLVKAIGVPENMNVDNPRDGQRFRVMVQNFTGTAARPMVNVYCGGHLRGTIGAAPDTIGDFTGAPGATSVGAMWRAADVTVRVDAMGVTTGCDVTPLRPPGSRTGYWVTRNDPSY